MNIVKNSNWFYPHRVFIWGKVKKKRKVKKMTVKVDYDHRYSTISIMFKIFYSGFLCYGVI